MSQIFGTDFLPAIPIDGTALQFENFEQARSVRWHYKFGLLKLSKNIFDSCWFRKRLEIGRKAATSHRWHFWAYLHQKIFSWSSELANFFVYFTNCSKGYNWSNSFWWTTVRTTVEILGNQEIKRSPLHLEDKIIPKRNTGELCDTDWPKKHWWSERQFCEFECLHRKGTRPAA